MTLMVTPSKGFPEAEVSGASVFAQADNSKLMITSTAIKTNVAFFIFIPPVMI